MLECTTLVCREPNANLWVSSSHSPDWPSESLSVLCVELHEPEVVLRARLVRSPLPQRVCRHQYPQWLLRALKHPTVTTQTLQCTHCASFSTWKYHSVKVTEDTLRGIRLKYVVLWMNTSVSPKNLLCVFLYVQNLLMTWPLYRQIQCFLWSLIDFILLHFHFLSIMPSHASVSS